MDISPETLKVILIIISAIVAIIVSVVSYYVIAFLKGLGRDKLRMDRRNALSHHKTTATYYAVSTNQNGFDINRFKQTYKDRLQELIDEDEIFKD